MLHGHLLGALAREMRPAVMKPLVAAIAAVAEVWLFVTCHRIFLFICK